jgi:copper transport protein
MKSLRALGALAVAAGFALLPATPASAHAELLGTTPPAGAQLDRPPAQVTLRFSEPVKPVPGGIQLLDSAGRPVGTAEASSLAAQVTLPVPADLADGAYLVTWRVVSVDSHPIGGSFGFSVGASGAVPPPSSSVTRSDSSVGAAYWLFRWLGYAALALLLGGVAFLLICWPAGWPSPRARRLVRIGWLGSVVAGIAVLLLHGPYVSGDSLGALLDPGLLRTTVDTGYGQLVLARLALLVLAAALPRRAAAGVVFALPPTWAWSGHARAGSGSVLAAAADTAHLLAMAAWLGGLAMLFYCVLPVTRGLPVREAAGVLPRFSRLAMAAIAILVVTGVFQAWRELRDVDLSEGSNYTRVLVFKVAAFGLLLCLGAGSRALVQYRYVRPAVVASGSPRVSPLASRQANRARNARRSRHAEQQRDRAALALLRKSVRLELAIAAVVIGLTAVLVSTSPSGHAHSDEPGYRGPFTAVLSLRAGGDVQVWVSPARPGPNDVVLNVRDDSGINRDVPEVRARFSNPALGAEPMAVPLTRTAVGRFSAQAVTLPSTGTWRLQISVRTSEVDEESVVAQVTVA